MADEPVLTIRRNFPRPQPELVAAFEGAFTGHVVDAQGRRGAIDHTIRPLVLPRPFVGTALTVLSAPRDNLAPYAALEVARPGDVLVIATGDYLGAAVMGDLLVGMAKNGGVVAVVTDGVVRDIGGLEQVGLPVFARGLTPNSPQKHGPGAVGFEVSLGGEVIRSGDIVVGDRDGLVVVPRERIGATLAGLEAVRAKERQMDAAVRGGMRTPPWLADVLAGPGVRWVD
jgi:4-hydroxy-4-methyl-2-oxoglutarate aldolase